MTDTGIILLGGNGKRMYPSSIYYNKHLTHVYGKPLFYYSLTLFILLGLKNIYLVVNKNDKNIFSKYFNDGKKIGISIKYIVQEKANGIPSAVYLCKKFINDKFLLLLGDNFLYGGELIKFLQEKINESTNARIFLRNTRNPEKYGIAKITNQKIKHFYEKPKKYISNDAIIGLYLFDRIFFEYFKKIKISQRGETEIVDILKHYLNDNLLSYSRLSLGSYWNDTGNLNEILNTSNFIYQMESSGLNKIGYVEYVSFLKGNISKKQLLKLISDMPDSDYKDQIVSLSK